MERNAEGVGGGGNWKRDRLLRERAMGLAEGEGRDWERERERIQTKGWRERKMEGLKVCVWGGGGGELVEREREEVGADRRQKETET